MKTNGYFREYAESYDIKRAGAMLTKAFFVACSISFDDNRKWLRHVKVEDDHTAVATDGRRLHMAKAEYLSPGIYDVLSVQKTRVAFGRIPDEEIDFEFPPYKRVVPTDAPVWTGNFSGGLNLSRKPEQFHVVQKLMYSFPEPTYFNVRYLDDLPDVNWEVHWYGPSKSIKFVSGDMTAVIMPMAVI